MISIKKNTGTKIVLWTAIITAGAASTIAGLWLYKQVKKMENYDLWFDKLSVRKFDINQLVIDIFMKFTNKSNLNVVLAKQEYDVYANGVFLTTVTNNAPNEVKAMETSTVASRIDVNPKDIIAKGIINPAQLLQAPKNIKIKIVMKYKVKVLFFSVPIPAIIFEDTLYNMMNY